MQAPGRTIWRLDAQLQSGMAKLAASTTLLHSCSATTRTPLGLWKLAQSLNRLSFTRTCAVYHRRPVESPRSSSWSCLAMRTLNSHAVAGTGKLNEEAVEDDEDEDDEEEDELSDDEESNACEDVNRLLQGGAKAADSSPAAIARVDRPPGPWKSRFPALTQREKKELRGHAHRLGKDICLQHIGKWGVTESSIKCLSDALEKNELMKVRVLDNCPTHVSQVIMELEDGLEAQVVGKVGRILLLYRPSLQKAERDDRTLEIATPKKKKNRRTRSRHARQARQRQESDAHGP